jgi:uncharacterized ParB-like nuclease family protein
MDQQKFQAIANKVVAEGKSTESMADDAKKELGDQFTPDVDRLTVRHDGNGSVFTWRKPGGQRLQVVAKPEADKAPARTTKKLDGPPENK